MDISAPKDYTGKVNVKTSPDDFLVSPDANSWKKDLKVAIKNGAGKFYCRKEKDGPAVLTIAGSDVKTVVVALNFAAPNEKRLLIELDNGKKLELKFKK